MTQPLTELATELERDRSTLDRELTEIDLLMRQAASEAERHESRRVQAEERFAALQRDGRSEQATVAEAHAQLLSQTRRQTMMQGQIEVLEGKKRALQRFRTRLDDITPALEAAGIGGAAAAALRPADGVPATGPASSREIMAAQEQMRRDIARQMHDGPAQSIANIALQAQVVQRLFDRDPGQAAAALAELVGMVQNALEQTKDFIFDVRPMVLDDLGLVPTLRRAAAERTRRSGHNVTFQSTGADGRLPTDIESGLFRIVDDAVQALLQAASDGVLVRLDWQETTLTATVRRGSGSQPSAGDAARAAVAAARRDRSMPAALASMIHEQESTVARGMTERAWADIRERAQPLGIEVALSADGWSVEATVSRRR
jgi:two-component system, NarL family, sensor histidine kinase DegS